jgi:DNA-binding CsgD family transcriptional regulator
LKLVSASRTAAAAELDVEDALDSVRAAIARADYVAAEALLAAIRPRRRIDSANRDILRARVARIVGDAEVWHAAAADAARSHPDAEGRLLAQALEASALKALGRTAESAALFRRLRADFDRCDPRTVAEVAYLLAVDAWEDRDYERAESLVARNVRIGAHVPESRALLGWIDVKREQFGASAVHFAAALTSLNAMPRDDARLRARLIHVLAIVASETIDLKLGQRVRRESESFAWPPSLGVERFNTVTCLRFLALLEGDVERAWFLSRDAAAIAPSPAYAAIGETNAAVASRLLGEERTADLQTTRAWDILEKVRWSSVDHEGRIALTNFAIECARSLPAEASKALTKYRSLAAKGNARSAFEQDRRVSAFEKVAAARVAEALGQRGSAIRMYGDALELWVELGYALRAALAALDVHRLTGDDERLEAAKTALEKAPSAWFGSWQKPDGPLDLLTPAERVVFFELLRGKTAKAIAAELDRSQHTVINHTRKVFAAFGVSSRAKLLARCAELGITVPKWGRRPRSTGRGSWRRD